MDRVVVEHRPFNAETPLEALTGEITPSNLFYVRNHFDLPTIDRRYWHLTLDGRVQRPLELSLEDLKRFPIRTETVTLECAGNGRTRLVPRPGGTPWGYGAVGTARFAGNRYP